jgi:hypothetical protein
VEIKIRDTAKSNRGWCKPSGGAKYGGNVTKKQFYGWLKNGLRHIRLPNGRIFTRYDWIDEYLESFEVENPNQKVADKLLEDF